MNNNTDAPGDAKSSGDDSGEPTAPVKSPRNTEVDRTTLSNDTPHVIYDPMPTTRVDIARHQRALRRSYHLRTAPPWVKKISWFLFPLYGVMRMHDPNYEEHFEQWKSQQRQNHDAGDPR